WDRSGAPRRPGGRLRTGGDSGGRFCERYWRRPCRPWQATCAPVRPGQEAARPAAPPPTARGARAAPPRVPAGRPARAPPRRPGTSGLAWPPHTLDEAISWFSCSTEARRWWVALLSPSSAADVSRTLAAMPPIASLIWWAPADWLFIPSLT